MADALAITKASMLYDMHRLQTISNNVANVATPGFKREIATGSDFAQILAVYTQQGVNATAIDSAQVTENVQNLRDLRTGSLKQTNDKFDIALDKDSFIEILTPNGTAYSKGGRFKLDASGRLVNSDGFLVNGSSGDIRLSTTEFSIDTTGKVFEGETQVGQLAVVSFENPEQLQYQGNGIYLASDAARPGVNKHSKVLQGFVEQSNVQQADEMVKMIEVTRHFEASQKVIKTYDAMLDSAINTLGDL
ncbi:MAG: flagellar hook-basal body protein [Gammaproteobacteria bacterium]|nr:MAG: flagellar hook-basal body protein [Gammaproteobacteria bacterium]